MKESRVKLAIVLLRLPDGSYVFQRRDPDAPSSPNALAFFGGHIEGRESPEVAIRRELAEETSIDVSKLKFECLGKKHFEPDHLPRRVVIYFRADIGTADFEVREGQGAEVYTLAEALARDDINSRLKSIMKEVLNSE